MDETKQSAQPGISDLTKHFQTFTEQEYQRLMEDYRNAIRQAGDKIYAMNHFADAINKQIYSLHSNHDHYFKTNAFKNDLIEKLDHLRKLYKDDYIRRLLEEIPPLRQLHLERMREGKYVTPYSWDREFIEQADEKQIIELLARYHALNNFLHYLWKQLDKKQPDEEAPFVKSRRQAHVPHSFELMNPNLPYEQLNQARRHLIEEGFIDKHTKVQQIRQAFSGKKIEEAIKWTGTISELSYFIKQLCRGNPPKAKDPKKKIWAVTAQCFGDKYGRPFQSSQMRDAKKPAARRASHLENICELFQ